MAMRVRALTQIATVGGGNDTKYSNTGLSANTTYNYRVQAYEGASNSAYSNTAAATTLAPAAAPTAPSALTATAVSSSQVSLTWADNSTNETGFKIERCTGSGCTNFAQIATVGSNVGAHSDTGLGSSGSDEYAYRVKAYNAAGNSAPSNIARATPPE